MFSLMWQVKRFEGVYVKLKPLHISNLYLLQCAMLRSDGNAKTDFEGEALKLIISSVDPWLSSQSHSTETLVTCSGKMMLKVAFVAEAQSSLKWSGFLSRTYRWSLLGIHGVSGDHRMRWSFPCRSWSFHTSRREPSLPRKCLLYLWPES